MNKDVIYKLIEKVQKPTRYTGNELGTYFKDESVDVRFAFCFPDLYEVGMSHLGMRILYTLLNKREDVWCERVFAPAEDMEKLLRETGMPLFALESKTPVKEFDIVGFTLQYELSYTNVLNMLSLSGIPLCAADRKGDMPIVIAGGPCAYHAEPLADFIDLFIMGEGETVELELIDVYKKYVTIENGKKILDKENFLKAAAKIKGIYVPSFYKPIYDTDTGIITEIRRTYDGAPEKVEKRVVPNLDEGFQLKELVVPFGDIVHDRAYLEIFRGCIRGCRFCQAGYIYRPVRERSPGVLADNAQCIIKSTGYDEMSLLSLSTSDYTNLEGLLDGLADLTEKQKVNLSLPSLRIDSFSPELAARLATPKKSSLTFAPEAGTQRMRDAINKNITEEEILNTCRTAFESGNTSVKLYFMMGLPGETDEDIVGIADLAQAVVDMYYKEGFKSKGGVMVTVSVSCFIPKPFTPFQWAAQDTMESLRRKQELLKRSIKSKKIHFKYHDADMSIMEAVLARGDRRLCSVLKTAFESGCTFDSWDTDFSLSRWQDAFEKEGLDMNFYTARQRSYDEVLPWDTVDIGVTKEFLISENEKAKQYLTTPNCREKCAMCGLKSAKGKEFLCRV